MIRLATHDDVEKSVEIGIKFAQDSYYGTMPVDPQKMLSMADWAVEAPDWLYLVSEEDGEQVGFFSAYLDTSMFGPAVIAMQHLMYILPEHRHGMTAVRFLKEFEKWAREVGADNLYFATSAFVDERFHALAERMGFDYIGPQFGKKL
jgi:GNAT superfamily N-acetyltransferase